MRMTHLLAFAAPLALLLPLSAQAAWPEKLKTEYMNDCVKAASQSVDEKTAQQHCACGADKLSAKLKTDELKALMDKNKAPEPALRTKALEAIQVCRAKK